MRIDQIDEELYLNKTYDTIKNPTLDIFGKNDDPLHLPEMGKDVEDNKKLDKVKQSEYLNAIGRKFLDLDSSQMGLMLNNSISQDVDRVANLESQNGRNSGFNGQQNQQMANIGLNKVSDAV